MEELGYSLAPVPFLSNAAAGLLIQAAGSDEQKQRWLPGIASGELRGAGRAAARRRGQARARRRRRRRDRALRRRGRAPWSSARRPSVEPVATMDSTRRYARVRAGGAGEALEGEPRAGHRRGAAGRVGRADRRRPARDGDGRGVRARPQAVRPADRRLPGGLAPLRADAARDRGRALGRPTTAPGPRTPSRRRSSWPPRWRRPTPRTPAGACARRRCRCTAASASPGSTTSTSS